LFVYFIGSGCDWKRCMSALSLYWRRRNLTAISCDCFVELYIPELHFGSVDHWSSRRVRQLCVPSA